MKSKASAVWKGNLKDGTGKISSSSGAINELAYSFKTRFEGEKGTNPEELIAAAHAACFSMALSHELATAGHNPTSVETTAEITLNKTDNGFSISNSDLICNAVVKDIEQSKFDELAEKAKNNCPISKLLNTEISLKSSLEN